MRTLKLGYTFEIQSNVSIIYFDLSCFPQLFHCARRYMVLAFAMSTGIGYRATQLHMITGSKDAEYQLLWEGGDADDEDTWVGGEVDRTGLRLSRRRTGEYQFHIYLGLLSVAKFILPPIFFETVPCGVDVNNTFACSRSSHLKGASACIKFMQVFSPTFLFSIRFFLPLFGDGNFSIVISYKLCAIL